MSLAAPWNGNDAACIPFRRRQNPARPSSKAECPESDHGERQEDAVGDLQKLSEAGRTTDPRKELSLC